MSIAPKPKKEPIMRSFSSDEEMVNNAETMYAKKGIADAELDKQKGFDIDDMESIMKFDISYTPLGNTVICKRIPKREDDKVGNILLIDNSNKGFKYFVITPGLSVSILKRGDIVMLKGGQVSVTERTFKEVKFEEVEYYDISGILSSRGVMEERLEQLEKLAAERRKAAGI